jgi:hypothetical protein
MMPPLHLQRAAEHLCRMGPRGLAEFLDALALALGDEAEAVIADHLARWRRLDPVMVRGVLDEFCAGRDFPPALVPVEAAA